MGRKELECDAVSSENLSKSHSGLWSWHGLHPKVGQWSRPSKLHTDLSSDASCLRSRNSYNCVLDNCVGTKATTDVENHSIISEHPLPVLKCLALWSKISSEDDNIQSGHFVAHLFSTQSISSPFSSCAFLVVIIICPSSTPGTSFLLLLFNH